MRPQGVPNKISSQIRNRIAELIESNLQTFATDLRELHPYQRLKILLELTAFAVPRLQPIPSDEIELLTDEQVSAIIKRLRDES